MDAEERSTFAWELHSEADTHTDALTRAPMQIGTHTHAQIHTHTRTHTDLTTRVTPACTESARCQRPAGASVVVGSFCLGVVFATLSALLCITLHLFLSQEMYASSICRSSDEEVPGRCRLGMVQRCTCTN